MKWLICFIMAISMFLPMSLTLGNGIDWTNGFVEVDGYSAPSTQANLSEQASMLAMRAAKADCYRNLLELVGGVRIDAQTRIKDMMAQNAQIHTQISGFIQAANIVKQNRLYDGSYHLVMRAPLYGITGLQRIVRLSSETERFNSETSQIILDKTGSKTDFNRKNIQVNLNWYHGSQNQADLPSSVDLNIGCFYERVSSRGIIDALYQSFGEFDSAPYISIAVDDRSGNVASGENLLVKGRHWDEFERILIYSYIYSGIDKWSAIDGVVVVRQQGRPNIVIRLDKPDLGEKICAIAMIEKTRPGAYEITKLGDYFSDDAAMAKAYRWNLRENID